MFIKRKIREIIKNNDVNYVIGRCINNLHDPNFIRLVKGYYESYYDYTSLLAVHNGGKYPDTMVYYVHLYTSNSGARGISGIGAMLRRSLELLSFSDLLGMVPVIEWGTDSTYYDTGMDSITRNVFEYYFEPVSPIDYREICECKNIIEAHTGHGHYLMEHADDCESYEVEEKEIEKLGNTYRNYIHLNKRTKEYIETNLKDIFKEGETVLAVHVRGTDFNIGTKNHPKVVTTQEYLEKTKELYAKGKYDKVFLATEDENALKLFRQEFNNNLLYYTDVFRTGNHISPHNTPDGRPLHYYKLGLEVLRDIYTLANCDSLICGLSQVSFAARYVKSSLEIEYRELIVINKGISKEDSVERIKSRHQFKRMHTI